MTYLSIIEKLNILFNTMLDFHFILVFSVLLIMFTFLYIVKKINIKKYSLLMILSFVVVFGISIISNYEVLYNTFDNFATIFFGNIYFPSIYVYIGVLVISFIAFIVSILNVMLKKVYKVINSIMFVVNNVLFVIILNIIAKNKIDIFSIDSLYTNTSLVAILELSMGLFILWILSLIVIYITNSICTRLVNKKTINKKVNKEVFNPVLEVSNDINILDDNNFDTLLVEDIDDNESNILVEQIDNVNEENVIVEETTNIFNDVIEDTSSVTFNDILNGTVPVTYYDNSYISNEYNLVDPQSVYEENYNKVKCDVIFNDILIEDSVINETEKKLLSVEELTKIEKERVSEERLSVNTISLNDLIDEEVIDKIEKIEDNMDVESKENNMYSLDDYKKFIEMLTEIKNHSNGNNINIDDAVAIGLINDYSVDDCIMFKNILENNLN